MDEILRIKQFVDSAASTKVGQFSKVVVEPVLVVLGGEAASGQGFYTEVASSISVLSFMRQQRGITLNARVFPVTKRPGANPYSQMIIIGRASNSDICLGRTDVSKMHAYITPDLAGPEPVYRLVDGGSRNGTWVGDKKLKPHLPFELKSGHVIALGGVVFLGFYFPDDFHMELLSLAKNPR